MERAAAIQTQVVADGEGMQPHGSRHYGMGLISRGIWQDMMATTPCPPGVYAAVTLSIRS